MYNFDEETQRIMKKKLNKNDFSFKEYLPNTLKSELMSRNSFASTAHSVLETRRTNAQSVATKTNSRRDSFNVDINTL